MDKTDIDEVGYFLFSEALQDKSKLKFDLLTFKSPLEKNLEGQQEEKLWNYTNIQSRDPILNAIESNDILNQRWLGQNSNQLTKIMKVTFEVKNEDRTGKRPMAEHIFHVALRKPHS